MTHCPRVLVVAHLFVQGAEDEGNTSSARISHALDEIAALVLAPRCVAHGRLSHLPKPVRLTAVAPAAALPRLW